MSQIILADLTQPEGVKLLWQWLQDEGGWIVSGTSMRQRLKGTPNHPFEQQEKVSLSKTSSHRRKRSTC